MTGLTLRLLAAIAAGALVLAFVASLVLISSQGASSSTAANAATA